MREVVALPHAWHRIALPEEFSCWDAKTCEGCPSFMAWSRKLQHARPVELHFFQDFCCRDRDKLPPCGDRVRILSLLCIDDVPRDWLAKLPQLTELTICNLTSFTDTDHSMTVMRFLPRLRILRVRNSYLATFVKLIETGCAAQMQLHTLHIAGSNCKDKDISALADCGLPLTDLELECKLSDLAANDFKRMTHLTSLSLKPASWVPCEPEMLHAVRRTSAFLTPLAALRLRVFKLDISVEVQPSDGKSQHAAEFVDLAHLEVGHQDLLSLIKAPALTHLTLAYRYGLPPDDSADLSVFPALTSLAFLDYSIGPVAVPKNIPPTLTQLDLGVALSRLEDEGAFILGLPRLREVSISIRPDYPKTHDLKMLRTLESKGIRVVGLDVGTVNEEQLTAIAACVPHLRALTICRSSSVRRAFLRKTFGSGSGVRVSTMGFLDTVHFDVSEYICPRFDRIYGPTQDDYNDRIEHATGMC